jgi:hypothetical protein
LVLALLVLEERKHGEIFQRNYTTVARALDDTRAAARASLGRGLERADLLDHRLPQRLLGQCTGPRREGLWPRTWSSRYRNAIGTTHGRRAGACPGGGQGFVLTRRRGRRRAGPGRGRPPGRSPGATGKTRTGRTILSRPAPRRRWSGSRRAMPESISSCAAATLPSTHARHNAACRRLGSPAQTSFVRALGAGSWPGEMASAAHDGSSRASFL